MHTSGASVVACKLTSRARALVLRELPLWPRQSLLRQIGRFDLSIEPDWEIGDNRVEELPAPPLFLYAVPIK